MHIAASIFVLLYPVRNVVPSLKDIKDRITRYADLSTPIGL
jgi:hypothetical protein